MANLMVRDGERYICFADPDIGCHTLEQWGKLVDWASGSRHLETDSECETRGLNRWHATFRPFAVMGRRYTNHQLSGALSKPLRRDLQYYFVLDIETLFRFGRRCISVTKLHTHSMR